MTPLLLALLLLVRPAAAAEVRAHDPHALASYSMDPSRPLAGRVAPIPEWLLAMWRQEDQATDYANHPLTPKQKKEFAAALAGLPPRMRAALQERLIAFYFVSNLKGYGITSWVRDASSDTFITMILNPAAFDKTLSSLLTERERSAFRGAPDVAVDAGAGGSGIVYSLAHEGTHAYDFIRGLTPYTDPGLSADVLKAGKVSWDVWRDYGHPLPQDDFPARARLHFYGLGGGAALDAEEAPSACAQLATSPFTSFYGSRTWAEDAAELYVTYHLTRDLGRSYRIRCGGMTIEPMRNPRIAARVEKILAPMLKADD